LGYFNQNAPFFTVLTAIESTPTKDFAKHFFTFILDHAYYFNDSVRQWLIDKSRDGLAQSREDIVSAFGGFGLDFGGFLGWLLFFGDQWPHFGSTARPRLAGDLHPLANVGGDLMLILAVLLVAGESNDFLNDGEIVPLAFSEEMGFDAGIPDNLFGLAFICPAQLQAIF
jgi:hypothetical protein